MPLESATYINQLESSNPAATDQIAQADDHLRLLKFVLKSTFPNITGAVTLSQDEINSPLSIPVGIISAWYGSSSSVPAGYAICNGQTVARSDGSGNITLPDLRDRTVIGAGTIAAQGANVGAASSTGNTNAAGAHSHTISGGSHSHTFTTDGHALTINEIPGHTHGSGATFAGSQPFAFGSKSASGASGNVDYHTNGGGGVTPLTDSVGGGAAHTHTGSTSSAAVTSTSDTQGSHTHTISVSTIQPSIGLHWIMKI